MALPRLVAVAITDTVTVADMEPLDSASPWLQLALTHRSVSATNNERLEFLGDALIGFVLAELIYRRYPEADEGLMTLLRTYLVNREFLAAMAVSANLDKALSERLSASDQYLVASTNVLAGTFEAWLAAVYHECGMARLREVVERLYSPHWPKMDEYARDCGSGLKSAKSMLQEHLQKRGFALPSYKLIRAQGQEHQQIFFVECRIDSFGICTVGSGTRQRYAENSAAAKAYESIRSQTDSDA